MGNAKKTETKEFGEGFVYEQLSCAMQVESKKGKVETQR